MVNGRIALFLAAGLAIALPLEQYTIRFSLAPVDLFLILLFLISWPAFWRSRLHLQFPLAIPAWLIILGGLVGTIALLDFSASMIALFQEIYIFMVFITVVNAFIEKKTFLVFQKIWILVAAVESILLLMGRFHIGPEILRVAKGKDISDIGRSVGTFLNSNSAGSYMLVSLFLLLALPFPRNRWLRAAFVALFIGGIFATGGNGSLLGILLGIMATLLYWAYRKGHAFLLAGGIGSILALFAAGYLLSSGSIQSPFIRVNRSSFLFAFSRPEDKLDKRLGIWGSGLTAFDQYPSGIGPNVTKTVVGGGMHNDFLAFLVERGPIGFAGLILLIGESLLWLFWLSRRGVWRHHLAVGALLGGLAAVWGAMATTHEITHERQVWLFVAAVYLYYKFERIEIEHTEIVRAGWAQLKYQEG